MQELALAALAVDAGTRPMLSARPDSPVVPERPPNRARVATAAALRRLATHLDHDTSPKPALSGHAAA
ncbi:hypothetical protein [Paractinoplanes atraurantiacus]|uniref:Uncharacterized protein n=1 Tax=Paractinoplanes atraurantiacus TaxID=1036182 RepID=A0A285JP54_9ACTN|nr:hypothetical protein [Actinoplanes atraurantiacus]SNY62048.1 hypothetical protein SAMN05421748_12370 [Actinoplanes atraurantiacus]